MSITVGVNVNVNCLNATVYINEVVYENGFTPNSPIGLPPYVIRVVADEGHWFFDYELNARIRYTNGWSETLPILQNITIDDDYWNEGYTEFIFEWNPPSYIYNDMVRLRIEGFNAIEGGEEPDAPDAPDLIDTLSAIYHPTIGEVKSLADERYVSGMENVPIRNFIHNLYTLPFDVSELDGERKNVELGGGTLNTESTILTQSILNVLVAEIHVPAKYNNAYDYIKTTCTLYLPFIESIELDIERVIDKTITVEYVIDLYDGIATCNVYSEGELLISRLNEISRKIPFYQKTEVSSESPQIGKVLNNSVTVPFIEVVRNIPYNEVEGIGNEVSQVEVIGNLEGYVEVRTIHLQTSATKREQEMIISQLRNGVIIK